MRRILIATAVLSATNVFAVEPSKDDANAVERAREALSKKLEEAKAGGVILKKEDQKTANGRRGESSVPIETPEPLFPAMLRDEYETAPDCLTRSGLITAAAAASGDPLGRIERLLSRAWNGTKTDRDWNEARIAETYLAIGFFDEAYAIASKTTGPRAAAVSIFAATGLDLGVKMPEKPQAPDGCGELHLLAAKISRAYEADGLSFDGGDFQLIESLPSPVAQSIFDYISVAAIDRDKLDIAARVREARARIASASRRTQAESYSDATLLLTERPDVESAERLLSLTADPGPLRARALKNLVTGEVEAVLDDSRKATLYANLEDAHASSSEGDWKVALGDALIDHKMKNGDWRGALELFGQKLSNREFSNPRTTSAFTQVLSEKLLSGNIDDALSALAFVAENAEISASTLGDSAFSAAAESLVQLGAAEILEELLAFRVSGIADVDRLRSEAKLRSGDIDGLKHLISGREGQSELLDVIAAGCLEGAASAFPKFPASVASSPKAMETIAKAAWAKGDWKTAATLFHSANDLSPREELSERVALAYLASGAAEGASENERNRNPGNHDPALTHFFLLPPPADSTEALRKFSDGIAQEIEFVRKRVTP